MNFASTISTLALAAAGCGAASAQTAVKHIQTENAVIASAVKLIGIDHVGISSDLDGGGGIDGRKRVKTLRPRLDQSSSAAFPASRRTASF